MSAPHVVDAGGLQYLVSDDVTTEYSALIAGTAIDEVTHEPLPGIFTVRVDRQDVTVRAAGDGIFAVSGFGDQLAFPLTLNLSFSRPGYRPGTLSVVVAPGAVLPVDAGSVALRPVPVRLQGRVVQNNAGRDPIPNATLSAVTAGTLALRTAIHFNHAAGVTVRERALNPTGPVKSLIAAAGGSSSILVNSTVGIAPNTLLRLGSDRIAEYAVVSALGTAPGEVRLNGPLQRSFAAGEVVQRIARGAIGASTTLPRSADAGDGLLLVIASLTFTTYEIVDGAATEYNRANALTDAQGFFRLDGIGGVGTLDLRASAAGFLDLQVPWTIDYSQPVNAVSFRLST